jgi:uncharacterized protein
MAMGDRPAGHEDPGLEAKVAFLGRPDSYPERPQAVETLETHMSWVFLTDRHAYKLKKPVRYEFLDFSTLAARKADCEAEVRLNRRLASGVYLGTVALCRRAGGELRLGGAGPPVDWLVKMRRLPGELMLDARIRAGCLALAELDPAARLLADFYRVAPPVVTSAADYAARLAAMVRANERVLLESCYDMPAARVQVITRAQLDFIAEADGPTAARATAGRIVEGHGDLRPEHVFLGEPPAIIDCLEFDRELRCVDPVDELAFLAMECELLGAADAGARFLQIYRALNDDSPPSALLHFHKCLRACLRCKLSLWHVSDPAVTDSEPWRQKALRYLELAESYAAALTRRSQVTA